MNPRPLLSLLLAFLLALLLAGLAAAGGSGPAIAPRLAPPAPLNITFDSDVLSVAVQGDYAYVGLESGLVILDITNPLQPVRRGFLDTSVGFPPHFITSPRSLQVEDDLLVISTGDLFGTVDVSNPDRPLLLSPYQQFTNLSSPFKLFNRYLYLSQGGTFRIVDLHDPTQPQVIYAIEDSHLIGNMKSIDAEVNSLDGHTYVFMGGRRRCFPSHGCVGYPFLTWDVTDPLHPEVVWKHGTTDYTSIQVEDGYLYLTYYQPDMAILDVMHPQNPLLVGGYTVSDPSSSIIFISVSHDRLAAIDHRGKTLFLVDVADKAHPQEQSVYRELSLDSFSIGLAYEKNCVFTAEGERGLHIFCEARTHPQPPSLVWLPMVQRSESG